VVAQVITPVLSSSLVNTPSDFFPPISGSLFHSPAADVCLRLTLPASTRALRFVIAVSTLLAKRLSVSFMNLALLIPEQNK
jgi:hypothetical protein